MVILKTNMGPISIELDLENTPKTVANFLKYAENGFYENTIFHRVINGFMIQGGGITVAMEKKITRDAIENEADKAKPNKRGTIAMARTSDPHSASSQFFINVIDNNFLNYSKKTADGWGYCVFGEIVDGMDIVDAIRKVETAPREGYEDVPVKAIIIEKITIQKDKPE